MLKKQEFYLLGQILKPKIFTYFALILFLFVILFGPLVVFPNTGIQIGLPRSLALILGALILALSFKEKPKEVLDAIAKASCLGLLLYFFSDLPLRVASFSQQAFPFMIWFLFFSLSYLFFYKIANLYLYVLSGLGIVSAVLGILVGTDGKLIFSDDHPCFLYRLIQLKENFPKIPFYNPLWNGGVEAREFFASGILNVFSVFSPLIYMFEVESIYNVIVISLLFLVPFIISLCGSRLLKLPSPTSHIQFLLSLCSSLLWYRWGFSYGTLGFIFSSSLLPLNVILLNRFLDNGIYFGLGLSFLFSVSLSLMFLWSPLILVYGVVLLFSIGKLKQVFRRQNSFTILFLVLALNLPWVTVFYKASGVSEFISRSSVRVAVSDSASGSTKGIHDVSKFKIVNHKAENVTTLESILAGIQKISAYVNPLITFFGILSLFFYNSPNVRVFRPAILALFIIGVFGPLIKPQLELERLLIVMWLLMSWPSALIISDYLTKKAGRGMVALILSLISLCPFWLWKVTSNQSTEKYSLAEPLVYNLSNAIEKYSGEGRTLFAGFTLHELNAGHVAPLADWTKKPLIASSYQHDRWKYVDVIPEEYRRRKEEGVIEYLDLMNVSLVVAHDPKWKKWYGERRELFEDVWGEGQFKLYRRRLYTPNYFLSGEGRVVAQDGNSVSVTANTSSIVIKFNYLPFLEATDCQISAEKISDRLSFVRLDKCPLNTIVKIESQGVLKRFF